MLTDFGNLGGGGGSAAGAVKYNEPQSLTDAEKLQARQNIGVSSSGVTGAILYNEAQALTDSQKELARTNIGAVSQEDSDYFNDAVVGVIMDGNDHDALGLLCGQPPILFGAGTPQEAIVPDNWNQYNPETEEGYNWNGLPSAIGQQYINTAASTGGRYIAGRTSYDKSNANYYVLKWYNS